MRIFRLETNSIGTFRIILTGIEVSTRKAKDAAASAAIVAFQGFIPGIKYDKGIIPEEWQKWIDDNLGTKGKE